MEADVDANERKKQLDSLEDCARKGFEDAGLYGSLLDKIFFKTHKNGLCLILSVIFYLKFNNIDFSLCS